MKFNFEISDTALSMIFITLLVFFLLKNQGVNIGEMKTALTFDSFWPSLPHTSDAESGEKHPWEL